MKQFKLFVLALVLAFTANVYSQGWSYCPGSINMTGLGTNPGVYCLNATNAIVMGGTTTAKVYKTTNGGANFVDITPGITGPELYCGCMIDANIIMVGNGGTGSGNAIVWRSTNGGTTWTNVLTTGGSGGFFNGIVKSNLTSGFVVAQSDGPNGLGTQCSMYKSTDNGATWTGQQQAGVGFTIGSLPSVYCIDNQFYGNGASTTPRIAWTSNAGTTWTGTQITGLAGTFLSGVAFNDNKLNGIAATSTSFPNVSRTSTGPAGPWTTVSAGSGTSALNVLRWVPGTSICFLATSTLTNAIKMTTDNGATWVAQSTASLSGFFDISVQNNSGIINGYAVAGDGSVVKISTPVGVHGNQNEIPNSFALEQNYPNPFNPTTVIRFSVPQTTNVVLKVYNSMGQEIKTVVNEVRQAGNHEISVDLSGFSSGVYFYTINAGDFKETKKMMLVK